MRRSRAAEAESRRRPGRCARARTRRCWPSRPRWPPRCWPAARRRSSASPATASRARGRCGRSSWRANWRSRSSQTTVSTALLAHAVPDGHTADSWMEVVQAMMPEVLVGRQRQRAGHLRRVDRVLQRAPGEDGRAGGGRGAGAALPRRAVRRPAARCRWRWRRARARSITSRSMHRDRHRAAGGGAVRGGAASRRGVPRRRAPRAGARAGGRGGDRGACHRLQSRDGAGDVDAAGDRAWRRACTVSACSRRSARRRSTRPGRSAWSTTAARSRSASAPTCSCSTGRRR